MGGMEAYKAGMPKCVRANVSDFDKYGEDVFLRRCLSYLDVEEVNDYGLLSEINCFENPSPCVSGKVSFHPFKDSASYFQCLAEAHPTTTTTTTTCSTTTTTSTSTTSTTTSKTSSTTTSSTTTST